MKNKKKIIFIGIGLLILGILSTFIFKGKVNNRHRKIMIDIGHGGEDPGTISSLGDYEKDLNLELGLRLKKALKREGYRLYLSRENDEYVDNKLRAQIANDKEVDIFISLHMNAMENNKEVDGVQVLYYPDQEANNERLGRKFLDQVVASTKAGDRGNIPRENLTVLKFTKMPAFILESGFMTNDEELLRLKDPNYQDKIVKGILNFIFEFYE